MSTNIDTVKSLRVLLRDAYIQLILPTLPFVSDSVANRIESAGFNVDELLKEAKQVRDYAALGAPCVVCGESCTKDTGDRQGAVTWVDEQGRCVDCAPDEEEHDPYEPDGVRCCSVCGSDRVIDGLKKGTVYCLNCGFQAEPI